MFAYNCPIIRRSESRKWSLSNQESQLRPDVAIRKPFADLQTGDELAKTAMNPKPSIPGRFQIEVTMLMVIKLLHWIQKWRSTVDCVKIARRIFSEGAQWTLLTLEPQSVLTAWMDCKRRLWTQLNLNQRNRRGSSRQFYWFFRLLRSITGWSSRLRLQQSRFCSFSVL